MKQIGLFYKTDAKHTATIAKKIQEEFGDNIKVITIDNVEKKDFDIYDNIILGASTWFDGELPVYWDEIVPELSSLNLKNKKVAIFGLGDQLNYPDNFADSIGILAEVLNSGEATLIGFTSAKDYKFNKSKALKNNQFQGLVIDLENQPEKTDKRIKEWCKQLKSEF